MHRRITSAIAGFHRDEAGMTKEEVIGLALIAIPLLMLLIYFSKTIGEWLKSSYSDLSGQKASVPRTL